MKQIIKTCQQDLQQLSRQLSELDELKGVLDLPFDVDLKKEQMELVEQSRQLKEQLLTFNQGFLNQMADYSQKIDEANQVFIDKLS